MIQHCLLKTSPSLPLSAKLLLSWVCCSSLCGLFLPFPLCCIGLGAHLPSWAHSLPPCGFRQVFTADALPTVFFFFDPLVCRPPGSVPSQGPCLGFEPGPQWGYMRGSPTSLFVSLSFSFPSPSLKISK